MKSKRFQYAFRKNASKLHKEVGKMLRSSEVFSQYPIYQEYPVNKVNTNYENASHRFDWVIPKLNIVIECHGKQHYEVCDFGMETDKAIEAFQQGQKRDKVKKEAALQAKYIYIEIPYTLQGKFTWKKFWELYNFAKKESEEYNEDYDRPITKTYKFVEKYKDKQKEKRQEYLTSDKHKEKLKKAKEYRKKEYQKLKRIKDEL